MNGKILSLIVIFLMIVGSFGAVGIQINTLYNVDTNNIQMSDADIIPAVGTLRGKRKAVIAGIADYPGSANDLQYTDDDARGMKAVLCANGWSENDITLLIDSQGTKSNIEDELDDMASGTTASSISLFFFSGHGTQNYNGEAICCYDSDLYDYELNNILNDFNGKVVVIIDACHSGGMAPLGQDVDIDQFISDFINTVGAGNENRVILMACAADEHSYETDELQSGVFSFFVIEGLQGHADDEGDNNGVITAEETFDYAEPKTNSYMPSQNPQIFDGDLSKDVPIIGGAVVSDIEVTVNMYKIQKQDDVEFLPWDSPDWYYTLRVFSEDVGYITTQNGPDDMDEWTPNKEYTIEVIDYTVEIQIKLMEEDLFLDDLADVSSHTGWGVDNFFFDEWLNGEKRGAVYHGTYNLISDSLTGDDYYEDGDDYYVITGELDNNAGGEPDDGNDAKIWFDITDNYELPDPDLDVKGSLSGTAVKGTQNYYLGSFKVENIGTDPYGWMDSYLGWEIAECPSWGSNWKFDPNGETNLPSGDITTVDVHVDVPNTKGNYTGNIKVWNTEDHSDYGIVPVTLTVIKKGSNSVFSDFLQILRARFHSSSYFSTIYQYLKDN